MPICDTYIDDIDGGYSEAQAHWGHLESIVDWMDDWYLVATEESWRNNVKGALRHCEGALSALIYGYRTSTGAYRVPYYMRHCAGAYELTATKICEAWAVNNFEDRALTIAFIDRQRQILWNEPFDAIWAAKPKIEE
ncbi:unnamed protein product [marine sediment metagenome]|uniref:Uncharacterized protein n=1 Tax=marine sediment metagenome TaxID=412755 RepID=X1I0W5_9ZZZZ